VSGVRSPAVRALAVLLAFVLWSVANDADASAATRRDDEDHQIAASGVLVVSDFPDGWTEVGDDGGGNGFAKAARRLPACGAYLELRESTRGSPRAESAPFALGGSQVSNSVTVFTTKARAGAALNVFRRSSMASCFGGVFEKAFEAAYATGDDGQPTVESVDVDLRQSDVGDVGDGVAVYEGTARVTFSDDTEGTTGVGAAIVRVGRALDVFSYVIEPGSSVAFLPAAADASIDRLAAALAR
jgi:hypothetical protein